MAARKPQTAIDGVNIEIDTDFLKSWDGVLMAANMQRISNDEAISDGEKLLAVLEYYRRAVTNFDEVVENLGGGSAPASTVFETITKAFNASTAKNS